MTIDQAQERTRDAILKLRAETIQETDQRILDAADRGRSQIYVEGEAEEMRQLHTIYRLKGYTVTLEPHPDNWILRIDWSIQ